jgi:hypothetical protein
LTASMATWLSWMARLKIRTVFLHVLVNAFQGYLPLARDHTPSTLLEHMPQSEFLIPHHPCTHDTPENGWFLRHMMLVNYGKLTCKSTSTMDDLGWRRHLSTYIRWCKGCSFLGWYWRGLIWGTHSEINPSKLSLVISFDHTVHLSFPCHPMWRWWGAWRSGCPWRSLRSP